MRNDKAGWMKIKGNGLTVIGQYWTIIQEILMIPGIPENKK